MPDDSLTPDLTDLLPPELDAKEFRAWLEPLLGNYRVEMQMQKALLSCLDELTGVTRLAKVLEQARESLHNLPPQTDGAIAILWPRDEEQPKHWHAVRQRMDTDITYMTAALWYIARELRASKSKRGSKMKTGRDVLLAFIAKRLENLLGTKAARDRAAAILKRCGIPHV